jgi:hypothetical protein
VKPIIALAAFAVVMCQSLGAQEPAQQESKNKQFVTGQVWLDTDGKPIQAHGGTYRDMNLFADDDGKAYTFYASEGNWTMYVVRLNDEYTGPETPMVQDKTWVRILVRKMREAPAPFKYGKRYYLITSACTGWAPNAADYAVADNILGPWESKGNPCTGPEAELTFRSQSTCVLPVMGKPGSFIFMADRWMPRQLSDSRYRGITESCGWSDGEERRIILEV